MDGSPRVSPRLKPSPGAPAPGVADAGKESPLRAYEQQPGESNLWFDRFFRFCLLGSGRSLDQCYRDAMAEKAAYSGSPEPALPDGRRGTYSGSPEPALPDGRRGAYSGSPEPALPDGRQGNGLGQKAAGGRVGPRKKRAPGSWKVKAAAFDWNARAAEWDKEQRRLALEQVQAALDLARNASLEAMQFQIDLMRGKVAQVEGVELIHRRLASNSLLNRVGAVFEGLTVEEEDGAVQVVGIRINAPRPTGSDK